MKKHPSAQSLVVVLALSVASMSHAPAQDRPVRNNPFCSYESYKRLAPRFFKDPNLIHRVDTVHGRVTGKERDRIKRALRLHIGFDELGRHTLYIPKDDSNEVLGLLRIYTEPGRYGLVSLACLLNESLKVTDIKIIRYRGHHRAWFRDNRRLKERISSADVNKLRSWLDEPGHALSSAGHKALEPTSWTAEQLDFAVQIIRMSLKVIKSTEFTWSDVIAQYRAEQKSRQQQSPGGTKH